jgi:hypothetical protein
MSALAPHVSSLRTYALHLGIEAPSAVTPDRLDLMVDDRYRLRLLALPGGGVMIRSRLKTLPESASAQEALITQVGRLACAMMKHHASGCVVDEPGRSLWLQQTTASTSAADIDEAVGQFVNALTFWLKATATLPPK